MPVSIFGVFVGLAVSIILIIRKFNPVSSMFLGTIVGSLVGGASLHENLTLIIIPGVSSVIGIIIRIIAGGVLAGVLIESGAAESIAKGIVDKLGEKNALLALALSSMILLAAGIFLPVSVVILAPIALSVAERAEVSKYSAILAMSGGAKAGNIISPNPNTISAAEAFGLPLSEVMLGGLLPAITALAATVFLANLIKKRGFKLSSAALKRKSAGMMNLPAHIRANVNGAGDVHDVLPPFSKAIIAPLAAVFLLMLRPFGSVFGITFLANLNLDAFIVLPLGAVAGAIVMGKAGSMLEFINKGITRMAPVVLMLLGAGALTGLISNSVLPEFIITVMERFGIGISLLAPVSGAIMGAATGSAATGVIIAGSSFAETLLSHGVPALSAAVMIHAGAALLDVVPHGNYFLAGVDSMKVSMLQRMKVMPFEAMVGGIMTLTAVLLYI